MALPFFTACKAEHPNAKILAICKSWVAPIFENHPLIDGIISFQKKDLNGLKLTANSGRSLKALDLDKFYLLSDSFRAAYLAKQSNTTHRIGYPGQGRSGLLTKIIPRPKMEIHRSQHYLYLLKGKNREVNPALGSIELLAEEKDWARQELAELGIPNPIALFPFSVASSRSIPQLKVLEMLEKTDEPILIFGGKADKTKAEILIEASLNKKIQSVAGHYGLRESMALISQCEGAVSADSGLGHISANLGVPTISLFGAGDSNSTGPIGLYTKIINENVHCSPCQKNKCHNKEEPLLCLNKISPDLPWNALSEL